MIWAIKDNERIIASPKAAALCPTCKGDMIAKCGVVKAWHWSHKSVEECDPWSEPESEWHLSWKSNYPKEQQEVIIENHRADIKSKSETIIELQNSSISPDDICDREKFYGDMVWMINGETLGKGVNVIKKTEFFSFSWSSPPQSWFSSDKTIYIDLSERVKIIEEDMDDCLEKVSILFNKLSELLGQSPKDFNFRILSRYSGSPDYIKNQEILKFHEEGCNLSSEHSTLENSLNLFKRKDGEGYNSILYIKKLHKKIPCAGWGYLISKKEFINNFGDEYEKED